VVNKFLFLSCNLNVRYRDNNSLSIDPVVSYLKPLHVLVPYSRKVPLIVLSHERQVFRVF